MKIWLKSIFVIWLFFLALPVPVSASGPRFADIAGCIFDGMLFTFSKENPVAMSQPPKVRAYWLAVIPPSVDLAAYEGKKIRLQGFLYPGNTFKPDLAKGIEVLGTCDAGERLAIHHELPWVYRNQAKERARKNDWSNAWKYLDKALTIDSSNCSLYATRADFYVKQGKFQEAVQEAQRAVDYGCKRYPDWAFLAGLLEKVGKQRAALEAYEQALRACTYKPDKEKFQQKINQLKAITN
jgi:tetratricopeptide (TPR) repeat protein